MYAITGITGKVGGAVADALLASGQPVRAVVRSAGRARNWAARGCTVAVADMADAAALTAAFTGADAVFVLPPPVFDPAPGFPEARAVIDAVRTALLAARPRRIVSLSTIGAQAAETNLLSQHTLMEQALAGLPMPLTILRPGWFMENASWDIAAAREHGVLSSFLQPLDKPVPMVATADVGRVAAELLQQDRAGQRIVELEGPQRVTPNDIAAALTRVLERPVHAKEVSRDTWEVLFRFQGMRHPEARIRMLDGFNEGWIDFEAGPNHRMRGRVSLETVLRGLVEGSGAAE